MEKQFFYFLLGLFAISCNAPAPSNSNQSSDFKIESVKPIILENGKSWSKVMKSKDLSLLADLYDKDAHYLPDAENAFHGIQSITEYWKASMDFITDIKLEMETLDGTKEILCETGKGTVFILNQQGGTDPISFKYVNVWKLQKDGSYKVLIDTYNDIKPAQ